MTERAYSDKFGDLCQRAEETLREKHADSPSLDDLSAEDVQHLFHELQVYQVELVMQNEELRRAQQGLEASRDRYADLYDDSPVGYLTFSEREMVLEANLTIATLLGVARSDLIKQSLTRFIVGEDQDIYYLHRRRLFDTREPQVCELRMVRKDGAQFWARIEAVVAQSDEGQTVCRVSVSDISERVRADEQVKASLAEKEVLLQEIHHRVKNNLQSLIYLIDMQAERSENHGVRQAFASFRGRLYTMAIIHDKLYQSQDLARIDFGAYLRELVDHVCYVVAGGQAVTLRVNAEGTLINMNIATPCGLLVNELVTNALKYAFPPSWQGGDREGNEIRVEFGLYDGEYVLVVSDNGVGLPSDLDWRATESLGLKLVNLWATHQLAGSIEADTQAGTRFTIRFADRKQKKSDS